MGVGAGESRQVDQGPAKEAGSRLSSRSPPGGHAPWTLPFPGHWALAASRGAGTVQEGVLSSAEFSAGEFRFLSAKPSHNVGGGEEGGRSCGRKVGGRNSAGCGEPNCCVAHERTLEAVGVGSPPTPPPRDLLHLPWDQQALRIHLRKDGSEASSDTHLPWALLRTHRAAEERAGRVLRGHRGQETRLLGFLAVRRIRLLAPCRACERDLSTCAGAPSPQESRRPHLHLPCTPRTPPSPGAAGPGLIAAAEIQVRASKFLQNQVLLARGRPDPSLGQGLAQ